METTLRSTIMNMKKCAMERINNGGATVQEVNFKGSGYGHYKDICDVVSLLVYCPSERTYLITKEATGEFWIPSSKVQNNCWKKTALNIIYELFGMDEGSLCSLLRVYKIWLPNHTVPCVYHAVYKVSVKADLKKRTKIKSGMKNRLQWFNTVELERQRAHSTLRSPEVAMFALMAVGDHSKDLDATEMEVGTFVEISEDNVIIGVDVAGGAVTLTSNFQLLQAAGYTKEDQTRLYREFIELVYPALYMSPHVFTQLMLDIGWQRSQCTSLFRAADVACRGGLSFLELMLWSAALEPATQHSGLPAEIRCRYIFRYFDSNRDLLLEYVEFKELIATTRAARQLPVDTLSVARDADVCLRQLGLQPGSPLPLAEFLRGVGELLLRGTSSLLRAPRSILGYIIDLQEHDKVLGQLQGTTTPSTSKVITPSPGGGAHTAEVPRTGTSAARRTLPATKPDYTIAHYTVKLTKRLHQEMHELYHFDEDAVSPSTSRLLSAAVTSQELLSARSVPTEALAAVHYFASYIDKPSTPRGSECSNKAAWSWSTAREQAALGALLLRLADQVRDICAAEPRLLRLDAPVYLIGDLHGNLGALLGMERALWPWGAALCPARLVFLGDYVDRGQHGAELLAYLLACKLQRPQAVVLLRGNHEIRDIQKMFTFYNECIAKYGEVEGVKIWDAINNVFDVLPLAAVVDDKVFCCHGGIPPPWVCPLMSAIDKVPVPLPRPAEQSSVAWELLWNDPVRPHKMTASLALELAANEGFAANARRGTGHVFDQSALDRFLFANRLSHVVRAHEMHPNGFMCQLRGRLVSVFSSDHYCGGSNDSAVVFLEGGKITLLRINGLS